MLIPLVSLDTTVRWKRSTLILPLKISVTHGLWCGDSVYEKARPYDLQPSQKPIPTTSKQPADPDNFKTNGGLQPQQLKNTYPYSTLAHEIARFTNLALLLQERNFTLSKRLQIANNSSLTGPQVSFNLNDLEAKVPAMLLGLCEKQYEMGVVAFEARQMRKASQSELEIRWAFVAKQQMRAMEHLALALKAQTDKYLAEQH
ncbi:MAG: hypothetical protein Q9213_000737 [Squamulea squamosa]